MKLSPVWLLMLITCVIFGSATQAWGHADHFRELGTFTRHDGTPITVLKYYTDGIVLNDPASIRFRLQDGQEIAKTGYDSDASLSWARDQIKVYQFGLNPFPFAKHVYQFDGETLTDITSPWEVGYSVLVHTADYWRSYAGFVVIGLLLSRAGPALRRWKPDGWRMGLKGTGLAAVAAGWVLYALMLVMWPIYLLVLAVLWAGVIQAIKALKRNFAKPEEPAKLWSWVE